MWLFAFGMACGWWGVGFGVGDVETDFAALGNLRRVHELADRTDDGGELVDRKLNDPFRVAFVGMGV